MSTFKETNISNPGTSTKFGANDLDMVTKLLNGTTAGIAPAKIKSQNKFGFWDGICYFRNQADTRNTTIRGQSNTPTTDLELRLPPIVANDVLPALGLAETWTGLQQFDVGLTIKQISQPANPASGYHKLWIDPSDGHLNRIDSSGNVSDLETGGGGGGGGSLPANIILSESGLTAVRTYTFPNINGLLAAQNFANVFTAAPQKVSNNTEILITAYRPLNTISNNVSITLDLNNSSNAEYVAGKLTAQATTNTAGAEVTNLFLYSRVAGALQANVGINNTGNLLCGGPNRRILLSETGLTTTRTFTFPDANTLLAGQNFANAFSGANVFSGINKFNLAIKALPVAIPTTDAGYGQWVCDVGDANKPKFVRPSGVVDDLTTSIAAAIPYVYDPFPSTYSMTVDNTLSPDGKWRCQYRGSRPDSPSDIGQVGVRVPATPSGGFARVFYEYPYLSTYTGSGTSASLVKTTTSYFADFDVTLSMRTVDQRKSTSVQVWETAWIMFRFNEAHGTNFHHYYLALKTNGTIELGRKDNTTQAEEQTFLDTAGTYTYGLNAWIKVRIRAEGNHIQVWVNDVLKIDLVDDGTVGTHIDSILGTIPTLAPSSYMYTGLIGLYNEDAEVEFSPMTITELGSSSSVGAPDITNVIYVANDGSGDYLTLNDALATEGTKKKYVLGPGDHSLTTRILTSLSNVVITGSGIDVTRILFNCPSGESGFVVNGSLGPSRALTANSVKGAHTLTVGSGHGIVAGDWIYLYREVSMDSGTTRYDAEIHKVLSVTSTVLTLEDTIYEAYNTSTNSAAYKINFVKSFELSDLTMIDNRSTTIDHDFTADTLFNLCYNLRIRNVKFENMFYASCGIQNCFNAIMSGVGFESPRETSETPGIRYGLYALSATTNLTVNGAWGQRCRHSFTTNNKGGSPPEPGRCRNIILNGFFSFNADTAGFDTHESTVGIQFNGCAALGGYPGNITTTSKGFNTRSSATYNACWVEAAYTQAFTFFNNGDTAGTYDQPGADRVVMNACRINNTSPPGGTNKGVSINDNRSSIVINACQFYNIEDANIEIGDGVKNVEVNNCVFHSCGSGLSSSSGLIRCLGNVDDLTVTNNIFGAGTPPASGRPLYVVTSIDRLVYTGNNVNGLTNKEPVLGTSTDVTMHSNAGSITEKWANALTIDGVMFATVSKVNTDSPYTAGAKDKIIRIDATSGAFTLNLPSAVSALPGREYTIKRIDILASTNLVTITPNGSDTIDLAPNLVLRTAEFVTLQSDGVSDWTIAAKTGIANTMYYMRKGSTANRKYAAGNQGIYGGPLTSTTSPAANTLWALPFIVPKTTKFDTLSFNLTTGAAGTNARCGIYADDGNCYPGALIFDSGSIDCTTAATKNTTITSGLQVFPAGLYWLVWECDVANIQISILASTGTLYGILGNSGTFGITSYGYSVAHTFGTLATDANPFPASATLLNSAPAVGNPVPFIELRPI
jgi:hypothetical protein